MLLVWLYTLAFGVILGAELNAELERMWPSPEQQRAPRSERLRRRVLESSAGSAAKERIEQTLPGLVDVKVNNPVGFRADRRRFLQATTAGRAMKRLEVN